MEGMNCPGNNVIDVRPGYWRASPDSVVVIPCPGRQLVVRGRECLRSTLCQPGYTGPICAVCEDGYARLGETCVACPT